MSAQAISVGVPATPGVWRALLWKEWRQQRMVVVLLAIMPALLFAITFPFVSEMMRAGASIVAGIALALVPAVLGCCAFCNEEDDGSAEFLRRLPSGNLRLFATKMMPVIAGAGISFAALIAVAWGISSSLTGPEARNVLKAIGLLRGPGGLVAALGLISMGALPAFVWTWARRTMPCILVTLLMVAGIGILLAWMSASYMRVYLPPEDPSIHDFQYDLGRLTILPWWPSGIVFLIIAVASPLFWAWRRSGMGVWPRVRRTAFLLVLLPVAGFSIFAGRFAYFTYLASPAQFSDRGWAYPNFWNASGAPDGKWLPIEFRCPEWTSSRMATLNIESGEWRWLTKTSASSGTGWHSVSPSERWLLFQGMGPLWSRQTDLYDHCSAWAMNLPEREVQTFQDLFSSDQPSLKHWANIGWLNGNTCALDWDQEMAFADFDAGTIRICGNPLSKWFVLAREVRAHGVYELVAKLPIDWAKPGGFPILLRYSSELNEAQEFPGPDYGAQGHVLLADVAEGSPRLLLTVSADGLQRHEIMTLDSTQATFAKVGGEELSSMVAIGFVLEDEYLLFRSEGELALHNVKEDVTRFIQVDAGPDKAGIRSAQPSPSRTHALVMMRDKDVVVDLRTGRSVEIGRGYRLMHWLNDDTLLAMKIEGKVVRSWLINRDGSGKRPLFGERK